MRIYIYILFSHSKFIKEFEWVFPFKMELNFFLIVCLGKKGPERAIRIIWHQETTGHFTSKQKGSGRKDERGSLAFRAVWVLEEVAPPSNE